MIIRIHSKNVLLENGLSEAYVYMEKGKIVAVGDVQMPYDMEIEAGEAFVLPGLIDIHTHGALGFDFAETTPEGVAKAVEYHLRHGTTTILPTVTSSTFENTYKALETIETAMREEKYGACIAGVHLEGPYFSEKQSGAQDKSLITPPNKADYERLIARFGKIIRRWDYAPERDENGEFGAFLTANGILASAGHTDAKYADMCLAKEKGCRLITHLYSCTSTITREQGFRVLGVTECAYLWDDMYAEIIADGKHLPIELLRLIFKLKHPDSLILVTDSLRVAGCKEKYSSVGTVQCIIEDGVCKLPDRSAFAGSIATANRLINVSMEAGASLAQAVKMGSENPARLFGWKKGKIAVGYDADVIIADEAMNIQKTFVAGEAL